MALVVGMLLIYSLSELFSGMDIWTMRGRVKLTHSVEMLGWAPHLTERCAEVCAKFSLHEGILSEDMSVPGLLRRVSVNLNICLMFI